MYVLGRGKTQKQTDTMVVGFEGGRGNRRGQLPLLAEFRRGKTMFPHPTNVREVQRSLCNVDKNISLTGFITNVKPKIGACSTRPTHHD